MVSQSPTPGWTARPVMPRVRRGGRDYGGASGGLSVHPMSRAMSAATGRRRLAAAAFMLPEANSTSRSWRKSSPVQGRLDSKSSSIVTAKVGAEVLSLSTSLSCKLRGCWKTVPLPPPVLSRATFSAGFWRGEIANNSGLPAHTSALRCTGCSPKFSLLTRLSPNLRTSLF
jgi:hypothetical protein